MPRDARAYLSDILDACDAIIAAALGLDLAGASASLVSSRHHPSRPSFSR